MWSDQLAAVGKPLDDEDIINFIIGGLNPSFNTFVTSFSLTNRDLNFDDFQNELLNHEMMLQQQQIVAPDATTFALFSQKQGQGHRPFHHKNKPPQRFPPRQFNIRPSASNYATVNPRNNFPAPAQPTINTKSPNFSNNQNSHNLNNPNRVPCQIYGTTSHQALDCFHRMDYSYQGRHPPPQLTAMVAQTNATLDDQWFADSGANVHITNELENLSVQQPFQNDDTVAVGNGAGLTIEHIGSSTLNSPLSLNSFHLKNVLHCPNATANLLSIQSFCHDNSCYFIFTANYFL
jgi:hypothetical protein